MSYTPTLGDAASDFYRCANLAVQSKSFEGENFKTFLSNGKRIFEGNKSNLKSDKVVAVAKCLAKFSDESLEFEKRCENLFMASVLLR